jgi:hypothetical protein
MRLILCFLAPVRIALLLSIFSKSTVCIAEALQLGFFHKDWEIAFDNTLTCRAAGYQDDEAEAGISVLRTRLAGPTQPRCPVAASRRGLPSARQCADARRG